MARLDVDVLKYYTNCLHWHLPEETQQQAIDWLVVQAPRDRLSFIFQESEKFCWQNAVEVVKRIGYPENEAAFPSLVELFQDMNWPGAEEAVQYFQTLEKKVVLSYIEAGAAEARSSGDTCWLWFIYAVCERLGIEHVDFEDTELFDLMKYHYDND